MLPLLLLTLEFLAPTTLRRRTLELVLNRYTPLLLFLFLLSEKCLSDTQQSG
jgi:hypothetical protein